MVLAHNTVSPALRRSYIARNGGSGSLNALYISQGATGTKRTEIEASWLALKGGTGSGLNALWGSYLATKGFTTGSLEERMRSFFTTGTQA